MGGSQYGIEMSADEVETFLNRRGHGVLSFGGEEPYGIPLSFGYDPGADRCIFQLFSAPGSRKQTSLSGTDAVNLVTYEWNHIDDWRSVVVDGHLRPIEEGTEEATEASEVFFEHGSVVGAEVFDEPLEELDGQWYELEIERLSGYKSPYLD
jgi:nitroimidazol reductase NimA-like FMN-containing flavoprotein (pyridoxamine 5'-phosphate oxidase superfamily)